jgi:hypothetical protein
VVRNRLKRQGREITRSAPETDFVQLGRQMVSIWREAGLFVDDEQVRPPDPLGETRAAGDLDAENHG